MPPVTELIVVAGPLRGATIPVDRTLIVGRSRTCTIVLDDRLVSRQHCRIQPSGSSAAVTDLESENGTHINGKALQGEYLLRLNDEIRVGQTIFIASNAGQTGPRSDSTSSSIGDSTVIRQIDDSVYLKPDADLPATPRVLRDLQTLLGIGTALPAAKGLADVRHTLVEQTSEALGARKTLLLIENEEIPDSASRLARDLITQIRREKMSVLTKLDGSHLAAPLIAFQRLVGVLYVECEESIEERHLDLLSGIAGIAAPAIDSALHLGALEAEKHELEAELKIAHDLIGDSEAMQAVLRAIGKVAPTSATVLIEGESGTGKELAARAIHRNSLRAGRRFVAINCAAIPENLLESELFGYEKGAFTGATQQRKGRVEEAHGGTLFLDEIGEMAPLLQAKLLRFLQEQEFERLGGNRPISVDVRVIAATNRNLEQAVKQGSFRADLYYRLHVITLLMPALRDRVPDIAVLARHFLDKHRKTTPRLIHGITPQAMHCLNHYGWPGNVRELENTIQRALVMGAGSHILLEDLPDSIAESGSTLGEDETGAYHEEVHRAKQRIVKKTLEQSKGNISEAARRLGLHPNNLHRMMKTLGIRD